MVISMACCGIGSRLLNDTPELARRLVSSLYVILASGITGLWIPEGNRKDIVGKKISRKCSPYPSGLAVTNIDRKEERIP